MVFNYLKHLDPEREKVFLKEYFGKRVTTEQIGFFEVDLECFPETD